MKIAELSRQAQLINDLFLKARTLNHDVELLSHWAKYVCILISGFLENAIHLIYAEYIKNGSNENVRRFAIRQIERIQNPRANRFIEVTGFFNEDWGIKLQQYLDDDGRKEAINTVIDNRHLIAHGKSSNISLAPLSDYFKKIIKVCEYLENQCGIK